MIGVAGDSGSGKTTFTRAIREIFGAELVSTITMDDYHILDRQQRKEQGITPLDPRASDLDLLARHLRELKDGATIQKPVYNHRNGTIEAPVAFTPTRIVIIEGLHTLFSGALRSALDFSLFVDPEEEVKIAWKIQRDTGRRGYKRSEVLKEIEERRPDYIRYIAPQRRFADAVITIARSQWSGETQENDLYRVTLIQERLERTIRDVDLSIDLFDILSLADRNFLLGFEKERIGDRDMGALSFDGELHYDVIRKLEQNVEEQTGVHPISLFEDREYVTATGIIQLILAWRIIHRRIFMESENQP